MANSKAYAIIAGVGPGTGAAIAKKFAQAYSVVLLARSTSSYSSLAKEINDSGGDAIGVSTDVSSPESIKNVLKEIDAKFGPDSTCAVSPTRLEGQVGFSEAWRKLEEVIMKMSADLKCCAGSRLRYSMPLGNSRSSRSSSRPRRLSWRHSM